MSRWQEDLYQKGWNSLYWSNHDQPRTVSRYGSDSPEYRVISAKMLGTVLHMMSGTPYIYQGEEIGMTNKHFNNIEEFNDLMAKFHYQKMMQRGISNDDAIAFLNDFSRDHARVPVQWNNSEHAGFTSGTPWLPVNDNYVDINAEQAVEDKSSVYHTTVNSLPLEKATSMAKPLCTAITLYSIHKTAKSTPTFDQVVTNRCSLSQISPTKP